MSEWPQLSRLDRSIQRILVYQVFGYIASVRFDRSTVRTAGVASGY
jgi:hypothetical protein